METKQKKNLPFASEEEFQRIFMECMANGPKASEEVVKWREIYENAHDEFIGAVTEQDFRYGYECGWNATINAMKENQNEGDALNFPINKETFVAAWLENCRKSHGTITENDRLFAEVLSELLNQAYIRGLADGRKQTEEKAEV